MAEAAAQFQNGLDQLSLLPDNHDRQRREFDLLSALGAAFTAVKGNAAPETGHIYARALALWEQLDFPSEFLHIPYRQSRYHANCGRLDLAQRVDEDLLRVSRPRNDFCWARSGSRLLWSYPNGCRQVCFVAITFGTGACGLRSHLPLLDRPSGRNRTIPKTACEYR